LRSGPGGGFDRHLAIRPARARRTRRPTWRPIVNTFVFKSDGTKFTGSWITPQQVLDIVNGSIKGADIAFQTSDDHSTTTPRVANYTGALDGDQLTLTAVMGEPVGRGGTPTTITAGATRVASPEQAALDEAIAAARADAAATAAVVDAVRPRPWS